MLFLEAIVQNWGGFLMWCWSPSTKRHMDTTTSRSRFTLSSPHRRVLSWLDASDSPTRCDNSSKKVMPATKNGILKFSSPFCTWFHRFVVKPSPNLISYPVENSKFQVVCCFSRRKCQPTKSRFVTTATSVEPWKVLHYCIVNAACHNCFLLSRQQSARTFWLPLKISLFSNSQTKKSS